MYQLNGTPTVHSNPLVAFWDYVTAFDRVMHIIQYFKRKRLASSKYIVFSQCRLCVCMSVCVPVYQEVTLGRLVYQCIIPITLKLTWNDTSGRYWLRRFKVSPLLVYLTNRGKDFISISILFLKFFQIHLQVHNAYINEFFDSNQGWDFLHYLFFCTALKSICHNKYITTVNYL